MNEGDPVIAMVTGADGIALHCRKQNGRRGDRTPAAASFGKGIRDGCEKLVAERGPRL
jgi:hypothetical protein